MADRRPTVYFHLEMGVHLRPENHNHTSSHSNPPKNQISYMNKSARHRAQRFPRHLPPANANYLAPTTNYLPPAAAPQHHHNHSQYPYQWYYPEAQAPVHAQAQAHNRRRENARPAYERGRSAPPPLSDNSWDALPEPMTASALPTRQHPNQAHTQIPKSKPQIWKELPPTPAQFRLGHDAMPWSPSQDFDSHTPDSLLISPDSAAVPQQQARHVDDRDKVRTTEMQSLATAMMTVDNGFEDQWWYQGEPRLVNIAGDLIAPAALAERYQSQHGGQIPVHPIPGDIVSAQTAASPAGTIADIVSPVSDYSSGSSVVLRRSLTTRSEELYLDR